MSRKIVVAQRPSTGWWTLLWSLVIIALFVGSLMGCAVPGDRTQPCTAGCRVPAPQGPLYVPLCGAGESGPCVGAMAGQWVYMDTGQPFPRGRVLAACATEEGTAQGAACVWVPSAMGNGTGDMGAYVWGVDGHGFPLPSEVEPS